MSTELAVTTEQGLDVAATRARLPELVEAEDTEGLADIAHMARLVQLHEEAMGHKATADECGRLKVQAEAGIGLIDIGTNPQKSDVPLRIRGDVVTMHRRNYYRLLGYGDLQGLLEAAISDVAADPHREVTTRIVAEEVRAKGGGRWGTGPLLAAIEQIGGTQESVASRCGVTRNVITNLFHKKTVRYETGVLLARGLQIDTALLVPRPRQQSAISASDRRKRENASKQRKRDAKRVADLIARDEAVRARPGHVADMYHLVRKAEQLATGARTQLHHADARALLDSAVIDLMEAAGKLHQALLLADNP